MIQTSPSATRFAGLIAEGQSSKRVNRGRTFRSERLAAIVRNFHSEMGILTPAVERNIQLLSDGARIVRVAHQPNLFAYLNVIAHALYVSHIASQLNTRGLPTVPAFFVVDYDAVSDRRFKTSALPYPLHHDGQLSLSLKIPTSQLASVPWALDFNPSQIEFWQKKWWHYCETIAAHSGGRDIGSVLSSRLDISDLVPRSSKTAPLSTCLTAIIAKYLIVSSNIPLLFFPLHETLWLFEDDLSIIIRRMLDGNLLELDERERKRLPVWYVCRTCSSRNAITCIRDTVHFGCEICRAEFTADAGRFVNKPISLLHGQLAPTVLADYILDYQGYEIAGGSCYGSGSSALYGAREMCRRLNIEPPPDIAWKLSPLYAGPAESLAFDLATKLQKTDERVRKAVGISTNGRTSMAYFAGLPKFGTPLITGIGAKLESDPPADEMKIELPPELGSISHQNDVIGFLQESRRNSRDEG